MRWRETEKKICKKDLDRGRDKEITRKRGEGTQIYRGEREGRKRETRDERVTVEREERWYECEGGNKTNKDRERKV